MEGPGGIDPATSSSLSSKACDNTNYVPSDPAFRIDGNRVTELSLLFVRVLFPWSAFLLFA
jgi:hypothetical protein